MKKYIIISPVRNEEEYIELTLNSIVNQNLLPLEYILVNDGSTDKTAEIIEEYQKKYKWIKRIDLEDRGYYLPGTGVVNVFNKGFEQISHQDWEYVVKLDCDLEFGPAYFQDLLAEFDKDPKLGIASGITIIPVQGRFVPEQVQPDHPVGPSKVYKRECFEKMNGLLPVPGWDLADILAAQMNGFTTNCFPDLRIKHYRLTGSRRKGVFQPKFLQGQFEYQHGYHFYYNIFKAAYHVFQKPAVIGSIGKVTGYMYAALTRKDFLFDKDMRKFLRKKQRQTLKSKVFKKA